MNFPRTEREARARSRRKLTSIRNHSKTKLYDIAAFWDAGPVSSQIDTFLDHIDEQIEAINELMDETIERHENEENDYV